MARLHELEVGAVAAFVAQVAVVFVRHSELRSFSSDAIQLLCSILAIIACWQAFQRSQLYARTFWLMTFTTCVFWAAAQSTSMYIFYTEQNGTGNTPLLSGTLFFVSFLPMFLGVMLPAPSADAERRIDWERVIDTFYVSMLILALYVILVILPIAVEGNRHDPESPRLIALMMRNILLVFAFGARMLVDRTAAMTRLLRPIGAAFALYAVGTYVGNQLDLQRVNPAGDLFDLAWSLPFLLITVAAVRWKPEIVPTKWTFGILGVALVYVTALLMPITLLALFRKVVREQIVLGMAVLMMAMVLYTVRLALMSRRQKMYVEALDSSELRYRTLFDRNMAGVFRSTMSGKLLEFNDAFARMYGYEREELMRLPSHELYFGGAEERSRLIEFRKKNPTEQFEVRYKKKDGSALWAMQSISMTKTKSGEEVIEGTLLDVTARHVLEEQLRQAQKMEAVGRLAGGVAHDFNNLLTVISGYSQIQMEETAPGTALHEHAEQVFEASQRAAALTRQLLAFSRQQVLQPQVLRLNTILESMHKMLSRLIGEDIEVRTLCAPDLPSVRLDPAQIEQVILNLAINARDAMPKGGVLTLETECSELDETYTSGHPDVTPGLYVRLTVSDNGIGMDQSTVARIFEPFFTTKETGKGTGLGLATVYGVVKQSGGHITVYSEPGLGTTFRLYFPVAGKSAAETIAPKPALPNVNRGKETILVVEDDSALRELTRSILASHGYRVLVAQNGDEASRLCGENSRHIDLLLTDVIMPGMSGKEIASMCSALVPSLKVLYMSGYTSDVIMHHGVLDEGLAFLQKPFTPVGLSAKVRQVLDGAAGAGAD